MASVPFNTLTVSVGHSPLDLRLLAAGQKQPVTPIALERSAKGEGLSLVAYRKRTRHELWQGAGSQGWIERAGRDALYCVLPGEAVLEISQSADGPVCAPLALKSAPVSLFQGADEFFAAGKNGRLRVLAKDGTQREVLALPDGAAPARVGRVARKRDGALVVVANNAPLGFQLWRQTDDGWDHLVKNGLFKDGNNAVIYDCVPFADGFLMAVGPGQEVLSHLWGLNIAGELIFLAPGGDCQLVTGARRAGRVGLMEPLAGTGNPAASEQGHFTRLARQGDEALALASQGDGTARIYRLKPDFSIEIEAQIEDSAIADLLPGRRKGDRSSLLALG